MGKKGSATRRADSSKGSESEPGQLTLMTAVSGFGDNEALQILRVLVEQGDDVNQIEGGMGLLHVCVRQNRFKSLCFLIQKGAPVDQRDSSGDTPLHTACVFDRAVAVRTLLNAGANARIKNNDGFTAMLLAASHSSLESMNVLLEKCPFISVNEKESRDKLTPILATGSPEVTQRLINLKADIHVSFGEGLTCVHTAASLFYLEKLKVLLSAGCKVNPTTKRSETPLHFACKSAHAEQPGFVDLVKVLLDAGASQEIPNDCGHTCFHTAAKNRHTDIAALLVSRGGSSFCDYSKCRPCAAMAKKVAPLLPDEALQYLPAELRRAEERSRAVSKKKMEDQREHERRLEEAKEHFEMEPMVDVEAEIRLCKEELARHANGRINVDSSSA